MPEKENSMSSDFRLIAIRPLDGCSIEYSKNLKPGEIYKFYNTYEFFKEDNNNINSKVLKVISIPDTTDNLFSSDSLSLNISAIVGKNGSGKSTLLEFIYLTGFLLAEKYGNIELLNVKKPTRDPNKSVPPNFFDLSQELETVKIDLKYELYYTVNNKIHRLICNGSNYIYSQQQVHRNKVLSWEDISDEEINDYFYSIVTNYSLYGLNEKLNPWLAPLFHKNDGYQTPIVINPYRVDGNINVNSEHHLAQSRVLSNLETLNILEVLETKELECINFEFSPNKLSTLFSVSFNSLLHLYGVEPLIIFEKLFKKLYETEFNYEHSDKQIIKESIFSSGNDAYKFEKRESNIDYVILEANLIKYVIYKVFKLCLTDQHYKSLYTEAKEVNGIKLSIPKDIDDLTDNLAKDKSHLTLKIRQIMNVIKSRFFDIKAISKAESSFDSKSYSFHISMGLKEYVSLKKNRINRLKKEDNDPLEFIPAAFGIVNLFIKDRLNNDENSSFKILSSGEQQLLLTLQTIYYHLYNLNSVDKRQDKAKYSNICIIIDEVELYFHPEFQRKFISELYSGLNKMSLENIKAINIIFSTHSPFILSDIPSQNILRLEKGEPTKKKNKQTFAANIYDLLKDDFFMEKGFIGEFAKQKIEELFDELIDLRDTQEEITYPEYVKLRQRVEIIGDRIIRTRLEDVLYEIKYQKSANELKAEELEKQARELRNKLN